MPITPRLARHTIEDLADGTEILIPSLKQPLQVLFLGFWIIGWAFGEITVSRILLAGKVFGGPSLFFIAWLGIWTMGGLFSIYILFWLL